jgi:hypothetical protein
VFTRTLIARHLPGWRLSSEHASSDAHLFKFAWAMVTVERFTENRIMQWRTVYVDETGCVEWDTYICGQGYVRAADGRKLQ